MRAPRTSFVASTLCLVAAVAACAQRAPERAPQGPPPAPPASLAKGVHFGAAAETKMAVQAASDVVRQGGSAVDGAIAAALVSGVVAPQSSGIGGGGFAMVYSARDNKVTLLDFRETAPAGLDPAAFDGPEHPAKGVRVGVPGEAAGLWELHRRFGKFAFARDAAAAIAYADGGFTPEQHFRRIFAAVLPTVEKAAFSTEFAAFARAPDPKPPLRNPALAQTLRAVAGGPRAFYEGPIARCVVDAVRAGGGSMTEDDLRNYKVVEREPLRARWEGLEVVTMPPPSGGGLMLLETLGSFSRADLASLDLSTAAGVHRMAETMRGALADRTRSVGDPAFRPFDPAAWLAPGRLQARKAQTRDDATRPTSAFVAEDHGTSHLVVSDPEGNVVTLTTTVNGPYGAQLVGESCGVLLNNELDDFTPRPQAAKIGVTDPPGAAHPGARPPSSMMPTIVFDQGRPVLALGGSGGMRIATGVTQVVARVLGQGATVEQAVRAPRLHLSLEGDLILEPEMVPQAAFDDLAKRGEKVRLDGSVWSLSAIQGLQAEAGFGRGPERGVGDARKYCASQVE